MDAKVRETVSGYMAEKRPGPASGHPHFRPDDPRAVNLLNVAESSSVPGRHIAALRTLSKAVDEASGRHLTINATAAMAALLSEIDIPSRISRGFAVISRAPARGHIYEEQQMPAEATIGMVAQEFIDCVGRSCRARPNKTPDARFGLPGHRLRPRQQQRRTRRRGRRR